MKPINETEAQARAKAYIKSLNDMADTIKNNKELTPEFKNQAAKNLEDLKKTEKADPPLFNIIKNEEIYKTVVQALENIVAGKGAESKSPIATTPEEAKKLIPNEIAVKLKGLLKDKDQLNSIIMFMVYLKKNKIITENIAKLKDIFKTKPDIVNKFLDEYKKIPKPDGVKPLEPFQKALSTDGVIDLIRAFMKPKADAGDEAKDTEAAEESPVVIDDERRKELQVAYEAFVDFYEAEDLTAQAEIIDKLLTVLANIKKPSDATMKKFARSKKRELGEAEGDAPTTPKLPPKNIASLKTAIRVFRRDIRKLIDLTKKAERLTAKNLLVGNEIREKLRNFVEKIQKNIIRLNKHIKMLLTTPEKKDKEEKEEETLQEDKIGEYKKKMEAVEKVHDFILSSNGLGDIMKFLIDPDADDPGWPEIKDKVDQALKQLKTIKGFFPSLVPFEGSEVKNSEMVSSLKKALKDFNLEASDLQTLGDTLAGEADIYVVQEFQTRLKEFSDQLKRIFGVSGIPDEDVVDKEEIAAPDEPEEVDPRAGTITPGRSDFIEQAKKKYDTRHELFDDLTPQQEEDLLAFLGALDYEPPKPVQESEEGERGPENIQAAVGDSLKDKLEKVPKEIMAKALAIFKDKPERLKALQSLIKQEKEEEKEAEQVEWASAQDVKKWINLNIFTKLATEMKAAGVEAKEDKQSLLLLIVSIIAFDPESNLRIGKIVNEISGDSEQETALNRPTKRVLSFMGIGTNEAPEFVRSLKPLKTGIIQWLIQWMQGGEKIGLKYKLMRSISKKLKGYKFNTKGLTKSIVKSLSPESEAASEKKKLKDIEKWINGKGAKLLDTKGISLATNEGLYQAIVRFELKDDKIEQIYKNGDTESSEFKWDAEQFFDLIKNKKAEYKGREYKFVYGEKARKQALEKQNQEIADKAKRKEAALKDMDGLIDSMYEGQDISDRNGVKDFLKEVLKYFIEKDMLDPPEFNTSSEVNEQTETDTYTRPQSSMKLKDIIYFMFEPQYGSFVQEKAIEYLKKIKKDKEKEEFTEAIQKFFTVHKDKFKDVLKQSLWSKLKRGISQMFDFELPRDGDKPKASKSPNANQPPSADTERDDSASPESGPKGPKDKKYNLPDDVIEDIRKRSEEQGFDEEMTNYVLEMAADIDAELRGDPPQTTTESIVDASSPKMDKRLAAKKRQRMAKNKKKKQYPQWHQNIYQVALRDKKTKIKGTANREIAKKILDDPEHKEVLEVIGNKAPEMFVQIFKMLASSSSKKLKTQQERLERALKPLIEKLMRGE